MASLTFKNVNKTFADGTRAVRDFSLEAEEGEFLVLLGPYACGNTTLLRMVAGLEEPTKGELYIDGKEMNGVASKERDVAFVMQNHSLNAAASVYDNIAYGLKIRKVPRAATEERVKAVAEILGLGDVLARKPKTLTGAQRLRVALGRAIVREPKLFLLDEPFGNLDGELRVRMIEEIARLQTRLAATFVYATHDVAEALTLGTRIAVLRDGALQQADTPQNLYENPANLFVATFIGSPAMNLFRRAKIVEADGEVSVCLADGEKIALPESIVSRIMNAETYVNTGKEVVLGAREEDMREGVAAACAAGRICLFDQASEASILARDENGGKPSKKA